MLQRHLSDHEIGRPSWWSDLEHGAPTIAGFAGLCASAMAIQTPPPVDQTLDQLPDEARTLLAAAAHRGTIEIRAHQEGFDAAERLLGVCIEVELDRWQFFLDKRDPEQTVRFLDSFRQLCLAGCVLHHLQQDFSLSAYGFDVARAAVARRTTPDSWFGTEIDHAQR